MRVSWIIGAAVLVLMAALVHAGPRPDETQQEEGNGGSKTWHAFKGFFSPVVNYFRGIPAKTPSDIADDITDRVTDVRDWAQDNEAIQTLRGALVPVRNWIKEKADTVKDKTFSDMYESVKSTVIDLDDKVGTWLQEKTSK